MVAMLPIVPMWLQRLAWPAHLQVDYAPNQTLAAASLLWREAAGAGLLLLALAVIYQTRRRAPVLCFGLLWCVMGLVPVSNVVPTGVVLAERTLFLPSIGFLLAVGALGERVVATRPRARRALVTACAALAMLGIIRSASRHHVWNSAHLKVVKRS